MNQPTYSFKAKTWLYMEQAGWTFVTLPPEYGAEIGKLRVTTEGRGAQA